MGPRQSHGSPVGSLRCVWPQAERRGCPPFTGSSWVGELTVLRATEALMLSRVAVRPPAAQTGRPRLQFQPRSRGLRPPSSPLTTAGWWPRRLTALRQVSLPSGSFGHRERRSASPRGLWLCFNRTPPGGAFGRGHVGRGSAVPWGGGGTSLRAFFWRSQTGSLERPCPKCRPHFLLIFLPKGRAGCGILRAPACRRT